MKYFGRLAIGGTLTANQADVGQWLTCTAQQGQQIGAAVISYVRISPVRCSRAGKDAETLATMNASKVRSVQLYFYFTFMF